MVIRVCYFTEQGKQLFERISGEWEEIIPEIRQRTQVLEAWVEESFQRHLPILFIGACGIAVRSIAPFVRDKLEDSPVLVMDEKGEFVIPILSGHVGGANALAKMIAERTGARAVITTATDVEGVFSVDVFAAENGLRIVGREGIRWISGKLLHGETVTVAIDPAVLLPKEPYPEGFRVIPYETAEADLRICAFSSEEALKRGGLRQKLLLISKHYVAGMGCKKGKSFEELKRFLEENLPEEVLDNLSAIASIDLKARESGLAALAQYERVPFCTYPAERLSAVKGDFSESAFVQSVTGVSNVCERAALCCAGEEGSLIIKKTARDGMTLALAEKRAAVRSWKSSPGI